MLARRPWIALGCALVLASAGALAGVLLSGGEKHGVGVVRTRPSRPHLVPSAPQPSTVAPNSAQTAVGLRIVRLVDRSRSIRLPDGRRQARAVVTYVRYPAQGFRSRGDQWRAPALHGPFPLIVSGHGFAVTHAIFNSQLRAWTRAGFFVAAPVFPLGNANAPGGPNEADIGNQPRDMSLVISRLLTASATPHSPLCGLIDRKHIDGEGWRPLPRASDPDAFAGAPTHSPV